MRCCNCTIGVAPNAIRFTLKRKGTKKKSGSISKSFFILRIFYTNPEYNTGAAAAGDEIVRATVKYIQHARHSQKERMNAAYPIHIVIHTCLYAGGFYNYTFLMESGVLICMYILFYS